MWYSSLKVLHILSVIVFLGNVFTGIFWMHIAMKSEDIPIVHHTIKGIIKSDQLFTIPSIIFLTTAGIMTAISGSIPLIRTGWILWSIILFTLSGIAFVWKVVPLQRKLYSLSDDSGASSTFDWSNLKKTHLSWELWGLFALITPLIALAMMTLKMPK